METKLYPGTPSNEMEDMLSANCLKTEEKDLPRYFTPEEMNAYRTDYFRNVLLIREQIKILNVAKLKYAEATKGAEAENKVLINHLQDGQMIVASQVYLFADEDSKMIGYYDNTGALVESRLMKPEERQLYIKRDNVQV